MHSVENAQGIAAALERELVDRFIPMLRQTERAGWIERRACLMDELAKYRSHESNTNTRQKVFE